MDFLVGNTGFVGANLSACHAFDGAFHSTNVSDAFGANPDLLVYSGVPAEMFLANTNPEADAARIGGELLVTTHGVITDVNSQPLKNDGTPIEGLYVCGNDQGGFYPHNYPSNFTGINAGRTATFARIAAKHALGVE